MKNIVFICVIGLVLLTINSPTIIDILSHLLDGISLVDLLHIIGMVFQ